MDMQSEQKPFGLYDEKMPLTATHPMAIGQATEDGKIPVPTVESSGSILPLVHFTAEEINADPILAFFTYAHLPERLQATSRIFAVAASQVILLASRSAERTVALRKLLEAKDAAVRAVVSVQTQG